MKSWKQFHSLPTFTPPPSSKDATWDSGGIGGIGTFVRGEDGSEYQGGNGCYFGGGGGGGLFGGGGGSYIPGIVGSGGGGSSFAEINGTQHASQSGNGRMPGGLNADPPLATGLGQWDTVGGYAGEGGEGQLESLEDGRSGAVRILFEGYF